jgi:hypothetical protein
MVDASALHIAGDAQTPLSRGEYRLVMIGPEFWHKNVWENAKESHHVTMNSTRALFTIASMRVAGTRKAIASAVAATAIAAGIVFLLRRIIF